MKKVIIITLGTVIGVVVSIKGYNFLVTTLNSFIQNYLIQEELNYVNNHYLDDFFQTYYNLPEGMVSIEDSMESKSYYSEDTFDRSILRMYGKRIYYTINISIPLRIKYNELDESMNLKMVYIFGNNPKDKDTYGKPITIIYQNDSPLKKLLDKFIPIS